jgi:hypothetical protein
MTRENFIRLLEESGWKQWDDGHTELECPDHYFNHGAANPIAVYQDGFSCSIGIWAKYKFSMHNLQQFFHAANLHERLEKVE